MKKVSFPFVKPRSIAFSRLDAQGILSLLESGFSFSKCLELLVNNENMAAVEQSIDALQKGQSAAEFLPDLMPKTLRSSLGAFLSFLPLKDALWITLKLDDYDQTTRRQLLRSLFSPLAMLGGCLCGIELFTLLCFPTLLDLMEDFNVSLSGLRFAQAVLSLVITFLFLSALCIAGLTLYFGRKKRCVLGYLLLCRIHLGGVFRHFLSTQFAVYFNACAALGSSTQMTLRMLQGIQEKPLIVFLAYHVEKGLLSGQPMEEAMSHLYLDPLLGRFMQIAAYSSSLKEMLKSYIEQGEAKGRRICLRWTRRITAFAYFSIGILVVLIYQILLMPLSILGQV